MDPAIIFFGLGVGFLVGMTGMGGGSLMTPLLVLVFGIKPTTAIGTDIFYAAITKSAGSWRHLKLKTVNLPLVYWMAVGSVPSAIAGVWFLDYLKRRLGDQLDETVFAILAGCLLVVGAATLLRGLFLADKIQERETFEMHTRHKVAAVGIGATTGFIIGLSSAGSGTLIGIMLIAVYRLTPRKVVGTDVVHAAILLWAASIAHIIGGNVDFGLAANILVGSVPGVILGSNLSVKAPQGFLRYALGVVLIGAGITIMNKANTDLVPWVVGGASLAIAALFAVQMALRKEVQHDPEEQAELERDARIERELAARAQARREPAAAGIED
ncbi:MAG TPA: sulfite exporter TauE/SafE family protein [Solirubrobacterales bacterium]|nr:sulfite exporter TauE/SafE family protein [Solirubrobacterales bacterium]